jgi:anti-sigma B factor antagonist
MPDTTNPRLFVETVGGVTVVTLADAELVAEDVIAGVVEQLDTVDVSSGRVVLNFRDVRLMSSTMLAVLLRFSRRVEAAGGKLKLCCIAPDLLTVFRITRFDRLFEIHAEESKALDSFDKSPA